MQMYDVIVRLSYSYILIGTLYLISSYMTQKCIEIALNLMMIYRWKLPCNLKMIMFSLFENLKQDMAEHMDEDASFTLTTVTQTK